MQNICENCKYFVKYYFKDKFGRYMRVNAAGHCKHPEIHYNSSKKIVRQNLPCGLFEPEELPPQDKTQSALDKLRRAELLISETERILKT